ncbi:MAG: hypothetical protein J6Y04_02255 [Bacteroidaceae bacterium]|nr:hypothetical protein [Bacteroidaceae bacterium]
MKKILFLMLMLVGASSVFAQTAEEKAALKAAEKQAKSQVAQGIKLREEVDALFLANQQELIKKDKANKELIAKNTGLIKEKSLEAIDVLKQALESGHVAEKQLFEANRAMYSAGKYVFSPELNKAASHEPFDTLALAKSLDAFCGGCYGMLDKGNPKDYVQKPLMEAAALDMPRMMQYYSYLTIFIMQNRDLDASIAAFDKYVGFEQKYPKWADDPSVKNPETPFSMFASNIYSLAYNQKKFDICEKYYEMALQYEDKGTNDFITSSYPLIFLERGDTARWIDETIIMIDKMPDAPNTEVAIQNLLAHYGKQDPKAMSDFADKMLAKNPNSKISNYGKAQSLFVQENYAEALPFYNKSVEIDPDFINGIYMSGMCLYRQAINNYSQYIDGKKYKTQAELNAAEEKYVKKYFREAAGYFEKCREKAPDQPDLWANPLQTSYKNIGEKAKAAELEKYLK